MKRKSHETGIEGFQQQEHSDEGCEFALVEVTPGLAALGSESFSEYPVNRPECLIVSGRVDKE